MAKFFGSNWVGSVCRLPAHRLLRLLTFLATLLLFTLKNSSTAESKLNLREPDRLKEYQARNYSWPLPHFIPDTPGWRRLMSRRFEQVERIPDVTSKEKGKKEERYWAWVGAMTSALVVPNFTETGWGLTRAPTDLFEALKASLHAGLANATTERYVGVIEAESRPLLVWRDDLNARALEELRPIHQKWSGVPLKGALAYGIRIYRNSSVLQMHIDKSRTHIIGCILHVEHSEDSMPWPLIIEDFQGNTNEVVMESGDMLIYESSKVLHGRPKPLKGSWYASIFLHYYPVGWDTENREMESHYAVPPHWKMAKPAEDHIDRLVAHGTSFEEPDCKDKWCALKDTVKWHGPAKEGLVITTGFEAGRPMQIDGEKRVLGSDEL